MVAKRIWTNWLAVLPDKRPSNADLIAIIKLRTGAEIVHTPSSPFLRTYAEDGPARAIIGLNFNVDADSFSLHAIHEWAELETASDQPGLWDNGDEPGFGRGYLGYDCPGDFRHQIAMEVEQMAAQYYKIGIDTDMSAANRRRRFRATLAAAWHGTHEPVPELETAEDDYAF